MKTLTRRIAPLLLVLIASAWTLAQDKPLTNEDVISLSKSGIAAEIIAAKVRTTPGSFDTSSEQLKTLKDAGVADIVVLAMVQYPQGSKSVVAEAGVDKVFANESKALVYVYRRRDGARLHPSVFVDGKDIGQTDNGRYFIIGLDAGKHTIEVNKGNSGGTLDFQAGHAYYFLVSWEPGFWWVHGNLQMMPRETGQLDVGKLKPIEAKWIKDTKQVSVTEPTP